MDSVDLEVLRGALAWRRQGHAVWLATVAQTWGSAPRQPGALLALNSQGAVLGSVSGGCVEDDLVERMRNAVLSGQAQSVLYGVSKEEAARFGLPCGGTLRLVIESIGDAGWLEDLLDRIARHELAARRLDLDTGGITLHEAVRGDSLAFDGKILTSIFGPRWRLLLIGAGPTSRILAQMAHALDFEVLVCDPREEYTAQWDVPGARIIPGMPDDVVLEIQPDPHTAIVALTHDPKLDDMALLEALKSQAFYVGAIGSQRNQEKRRERLAMFDITADQIARLSGPVGLQIGSRTPGEIAVSALAEIISVKNHSPIGASR